MMNGIQMGYEKYMQLHATYVLEVTLAADSMLAAELLPKFGTNLVAALADLQQSKIVVCALRMGWSRARGHLLTSTQCIAETVVAYYYLKSYDLTRHANKSFPGGGSTPAGTKDPG